RHRDWPIQLAVHNHATTDTISNIDDAALREGYSPPRHLTCDLPPSAVVEVINGSGDGCQNLQLFPSGGPGLEAVGILLLNEGRRQIALTPARVLHQRGQERNIVLDALDIEGIERLRLKLDGRLARWRVRNELGDHRVVVHGDLATLGHAGVDAHRHAFGRALDRRAVLHETTGGRQEVAEWVFGVDTALDGPAGEGDVILTEFQLLTGGDADHLLHEVDAGDHLGDRMLNLQARVHLQEVEALVLSCDELHRARRVVAHRLCQSDRLLAHGFAGRLVQQR